MFSINLTFDKTLTKQFCYRFRKIKHFLYYKCVSIQNSTILSHAQLLQPAVYSSTLAYTNLLLSLCCPIAAAAERAKVFKLSFEYTFITQKWWFLQKIAELHR